MYQQIYICKITFFKGKEDYLRCANYKKVLVQFSTHLFPKYLWIILYLGLEQTSFLCFATCWLYFTWVQNGLVSLALLLAGYTLPEFKMDWFPSLLCLLIKLYLGSKWTSFLSFATCWLYFMHLGLKWTGFLRFGTCGLYFSINWFPQLWYLWVILYLGSKWTGFLCFGTCGLYFTWL